MTDLSHYRIGPAKTRDGRDAVIYAIHPGQTYPIHGAIYKDTRDWVSVSWCYDGKYTLFVEPEYDSNLLPNNLPVTVSRWLPPDGSLTVSDTKHEGWTRVEVPVQLVRDEVVLFGRKFEESVAFDYFADKTDTHRLTLPVVPGDLVCGEYHDGMGNVIKVERIK